MDKRATPDPTTGAPLRSPGGLAERLAKLSALFCALALAGMALLIPTEVIARSLFNYSFQSIEELSAYGLVVVAFLSLSVVIHDDALFRAGFLIDRLADGRRRRLEIVFLVALLAFFVTIDYECFALVLNTYRGGYVAPTLLATPLFVPQLLMPVGITIAIVVLLAKLAAAIRGLARRAEGGDDGGRPQ